VALFGQAFDAAETYLLASLEAFGRAGQGSWGAAHVQHFLWRLSAFRGDPVGAADKLEESARLFREVGDDSALVLVLHNLALVALLRGDLARARTILREALDLSLALNNRWYTAYCLEGFGSLAALEQDGERAARLFGAADALRSAVNAPQTPFDQALYQGFVLGARALCGEEHYAEAFAAGRQQGLEATFELLERLPQAA
jgi:hypothetical protein